MLEGWAIIISTASILLSATTVPWIIIFWPGIFLWLLNDIFLDFGQLIQTLFRHFPFFLLFTIECSTLWHIQLWGGVRFACQVP